ncbi:RnfABCDGE type electron transport complex subunit B [endosymbiont 'TC1' of Trimyema compressum]|uniref:RnfABCDGE type electron transport complex subunit B n=1 Tax=endosymbiont 'TC1' of Trimyema compressum TaxID=243899 RepID=UPI000A947F27|nr:RnfABCDGE type electron transport complex subunit B [endosymbiont 'TC1' of Trimyema compressum]
MIYAIILLGAIGIIFGIILGVVNKKLSVKTDPREEAIIDALPGANCGACGFAGCAACGAAIFNGEAPIDACPVGGPACAEAIAAILGVEASSAEPSIARVACNGSPDNAKTLYDYTGAKSCIVAKTSFNGQKMCDFSCFGFGSCAAACPFEAIDMVNGLPVVNRKKCTSCGICVSTCPQTLMHLVPRKQHVFVNCSNLIKGKAVMAACKVGCIKCKKCEKTCEFDAIHVTDVARIDYDKCTNCQACVAVCPTKCITVDTFTDDFSKAPKAEDTEPAGCSSCASRDTCQSKE